MGIFAVQGGEDVKGNHVLLFGMTERAPVADPRSILNESLTDFPRDADRDEADDVVLQFPLQRTYFICGFCNGISGQRTGMDLRGNHARRVAPGKLKRSTVGSDYQQRSDSATMTHNNSDTTDDAESADETESRVPCPEPYCTIKMNERDAILAHLRWDHNRSEHEAESMLEDD